MTSRTYALRKPLLRDVDAVARVHVDAWRETYRDQLPETFFDERAFAFRQELWTRIVVEPAKDLRVILAERDGSVIGFAASGTPMPHEPPSPASRELSMIYLLAQHHGCGAGQAMLDAVLGSEPASLWVAKHNPRAHAFYERNGFRFDGIEKPDERVPSFLERRMVRL